jgi:predicted phosphate transport protein (TIGR00153 family)
MFGTSPIAGLFARSPFKPIQEHMKVVEECVAEIAPLFEAFGRGDQEAVDTKKERIDHLEHRADELKNQIRTHLPRGLFMPVDRRDLLDLLHAQDSIADVAQDIAGFLTLRRLEIPSTFGGDLTALVEQVFKAAQQCRKVIGQLDELVEMGFKGREVEYVEKQIDKLSEIESEADTLEMDLVRRLFALEDELKPGTFFIWYEIIQKLGDIADYAEDVGDRLRLLMAR